MDELKSIPGSHSWKKISPVLKGWSTDHKFHIITNDNQQLLLRVSDRNSFKKKQEEFEIMKEISAQNILMTSPIDFGMFNAGEAVFTLLTWVSGNDAEQELPLLSVSRQYQLGYTAGEIMRKIHSVPSPAGLDDWAPRFNRKIDRKIEIYRDCPVRIPGDDLILDLISQKRHLLADRPQSCQHGDYHVGNLVITNDGSVGVLDFNRFDFGDPWEEFNRIVWCAGISPAFASGRIDGYFGARIPGSFFDLMALYISVNALSSVPWAVPFGEGEVQLMLKQVKGILYSYDNFRTLIPKWYATSN